MQSERGRLARSRRTEAGSGEIPMVFATPFSGHRHPRANLPITLCGRPERAGRPRSNCIVPVKCGQTPSRRSRSGGRGGAAGLEVFAKEMTGADPEPGDLGTIPLADGAVFPAEADGPAFAGAVELFESQAGVIRVGHEERAGPPCRRLHAGGKCVIEPPEAGGSAGLHSRERSSGSEGPSARARSAQRWKLAILAGSAKTLSHSASSASATGSSPSCASRVLRNWANCTSVFWLAGRRERQASAKASGTSMVKVCGMRGVY